MLRLLPAKTTRQTVLFSATFPADTAQLADFACKPGHVMLDTIGEEEVHTATRVRISPPPLRPLHHEEAAL
jgi:ATP-dependent RNA helicase MSS116, mitochondrial